MRCDQFMGLPPAALRFLAEQAIKPVVCECCNRPFPVKHEVIELYDGMFEEQYPLHRIPLIDGYAEEYLQAAPWSSGPVHFHGLRVYDGGGELVSEFTWTSEEIDEAI